MDLYCSDCDCIKLETEFYLNSASKTNYSIYCKDCMKKRVKSYTYEHKEERQEYNRKWRTENPEKARNSYLIWKKANPKRVLSNNNKRRARKLQAMPLWLSKEDIQKIDQIYKSCPKGFHVDHIIPLKGKNISGLHVPWNLQVITANQNLKKSNKVV